MATYDNKHWLLSNIRNSFIATHTDDVIAGENYPKLLIKKANEEKSKIKENRKLKASGSQDAEQFDKEPVTEFDPYPDVVDEEDDLDMIGSYTRYDDGSYRQRSDTALWLEKKEPVMGKASKMKIINWEDPPILTNEERIQLFPRKDMPIPSEEDKEPVRSLLAEQLKNCPVLPHRQYQEYAKYDGNGQVGLPTKSFKIFMTMLPEALANYPITVCVITTAKIQDLIGFTCYRYSLEHQDVILGPANTYSLCIAEDDGEVDEAFPCLDPNEPCAKFDFTCLGLIELKAKSQNQASCSMTDDAFKDFPARSVTMTSTASEIMDQLSSFHRKSENRTSSSLDQDMLKMEIHFQASQAPQYKTYNVQLVNKMRANIEVLLGISMDSIDIEPRNNSSHKFWAKMKPQTYPMETIGCCQIIENKSNNGSVFRIKYSAFYSNRAGESSSASSSATPTFKSRDFECEQMLAKEIVDKINTILELRMTTCSKDYKAAKEKKLQTRRSFHVSRHHHHA